MRSLIFGIAALSSLVVAKPIISRYAVKETHHVPRQYTKVADAPGHHRVRLHVGLTQGKFGELERRLYEVSDPEHSNYGLHLSQEEVEELVKPNDETLSEVQQWLHQHVHPKKVEYSRARNFLSFTVTISEAERLLDTKYAVYRHEDGSTIVRAPEWKLPIHLHNHVTSIQPTTSFLRRAPKSNLHRRNAPEAPANNYTSPSSGASPPPTYGPDTPPEYPTNLPPEYPTNPPAEYPTNPPPEYPTNASNPSVEEACDINGVTPLCLRTVYETVDYKPQVPGLNVIGHTNYVGQISNRSDATLYLQEFRSEAISAASTFSEISVNGGVIDQGRINDTQFEAGIGLEGNLDSQTIIGIGFPTPLVTWSTGGEPPFIPDANFPENVNEPFHIWLDFVLSQEFLPQVISNSYGDDEQTVPESYAKVVCSQFAQLGARGVSVLFSSGDGGVGGVMPESQCISNVNNQSTFIPLFPASCPFVTTVGATSQFNPEMAADDPLSGFASGAGFSNYFPRPDYQSQVVPPYLDRLGDQFAGLFNREGRAYPDLAAHGSNYTIFFDGEQILVDGSSASCPTVATVFSLLNDALLAAGRKPLGFLNPWLYKNGFEAFNDVTVGSAKGCGTDGFPAVEGWDAVTGFGTPRFSRLLKAVGLSGEY